MENGYLKRRVNNNENPPYTHYNNNYHYNNNNNNNNRDYTPRKYNGNFNNNHYNDDNYHYNNHYHYDFYHYQQEPKYNKNVNFNENYRTFNNNREQRFKRSYSPYRNDRNQYIYTSNNYKPHRNFTPAYNNNNNNNNNNNYNNSNYKVPWDDENGYYLPRIGEYLISRYKLKNIVGMGTFSTVVECYDEHLCKDVAIKIVRSTKKYSEDAMIEIDILNSLEKNGITNLDNAKFSRCIRLLDWFKFKDHVCLVFAKHGISLYDFLKKNKYRPLALSDIQIISHQLFTAVKTMHSISLVHTDLKPENILLDGSNSPYQFYNDRIVPTQLIQQLQENNTPIDNYFHLQDPNVVVIDFGGATFEDSHHTTIVCSRPYRPPEIIIGMGWSYPADLWGLGCILLELYLGTTLFDTYNNKQHLLMMEKVCGPLPISMSDQIKNNSNSKSEWPDQHDESNKISRLKKLDEYVHPNHKSFLDLIKKLLEYHPSKRISALDALKHPFFGEKIINDLQRA